MDAHEDCNKHGPDFREDEQRPVEALVSCYAVFLNGVELPNFGRHKTSQDAFCAVMRSGLSGIALEGVTVDVVRS